MTRGQEIRDARLGHRLLLSAVAKRVKCGASYLSLIERDLRPCREGLFTQLIGAIEELGAERQRENVRQAVRELVAHAKHVSEVVGRNLGAARPHQPINAI